MHYFDENRPKLPNGVPLYCDLANKPIAAIPSLLIEPLDTTSVSISCFLLRSDRGAYRASCDWPISELPIVIASFIFDVELFLEANFKYYSLILTEPISEAAPPKRVLTLDDLDL